MKNPTDRREALWFCSGLVLLSVSVTLLFFIIVTVADPRSAPAPVAVVLITVISMGLGIYCVKRGRKSVGVELSQKDRELAGFVLGVALIAIGAWIAIILLPAVFVSIIVFVVIGGVGVLIGYKLKKIRSVLSWGLGVTACVYASVTSTFLYQTFGHSLLIDLLKTVVPIAVLGTLAFAWLERKKLSRDHKTWTVFMKVVPFTLLIVTPFIIGGLHDYNRRGDTSPPQVIQLKVIDKWIQQSFDPDSDEVFYRLRGETLDGSQTFSFGVSYSFYNEHDIGSTCEITLGSGALGYRWLEGYA